MGIPARAESEGESLEEAGELGLVDEAVVFEVDPLEGGGGIEACEVVAGDAVGGGEVLEGRVG